MITPPISGNVMILGDAHWVTRDAHRLTRDVVVERCLTVCTFLLSSELLARDGVYVVFGLTEER